MRRGVILLIFIILASLTARAQLSGTGTISNPYSGTLTANLTITGTMYFGGNITVDNETLTIQPGAKFISTSTSACIKITGTGKLYAAGSSASPITISADIDKDGIIGESTDIWGNIYITSTTASTISYCIIERGTRTSPKIGSMGGGIYISTSALTITNSTIRNCRAVRGGGIYVAAGHAPLITTTLFKDNVATENGGGAYLSSTSAPTIAASVFSGNSSVSATLNGGGIVSMGSAAKIANCTMVNNSSASSAGKSLYLENSPDMVVVNTAIWGGTSLISLSGTPSSVFAWCAIEGESYTGCQTLSSNNSDPTGPNFTNPATGDYSLIFDSPLRDAGIDTYAGVTFPLTDIMGTRKVGMPDIGAYEVLYSRWMGTATNDWARPINWDKSYSPGTTRNIIIPAGRTNYPTLTPGPSFILGAGLKMIVEPGAKVTFNSITNNGTIVIEANSTARASLMTNTYSGASGSLRVKQYVTGGEIVAGQTYRWHYIAPPATVNKSVITDITPYDLMMYDQSKVISDVSQGWQWHDGYDGSTAFSSLTANNGYLIWFPKDTILVYDNLKSMTTAIGQINLPFNGSGGDTSLYGYSCVGNSLTCAINWDLVTLSDPSHVRNAIYIQSGDVVASYVNGVGTNGGSAHIAPLQGFMVKTRAVGTYITIPLTAREHNSAPLLKSSHTIPLMRLALSSATGDRDETVIRLDDNATTGFDGNYDASKILVEYLPQLYTSLGSETYSINAVPWPDSYTEIPLSVSVPVAGTYSISRIAMSQLGTQKIWLTDHSTNTIIDLTSVADFPFTADAGITSTRFTLTISDSYPGTVQQVTNKSFSLTGKDNMVSVIPEGEKWNGERCTVKIYDTSGRLLLSENNEYLFDGEQKDYYLSKPNGILIVEITTGGNKFSRKIAVTP